MLDQGLEADLVSDIQKYLENLINNGLRHRLISLIKVWNIDQSFFHIVHISSVVFTLGFCM